MKLIKKLSPKRLFGSMKTRSMVSRSESSSFSFGATTSSSDEDSSVHKARSAGTPVSVLPNLSGEWSDGSSHSTSLDLYQAFKLIDRDNDGAISRSELEALLTRIGAEPMSRDETATMLREVGCYDADSCLNIEDLLGRVGSVSGPACDLELRETFDFFDTDHDGRITAEELMRVFTALGDDGCTLEDCRRMIADVDRNRDGFVCFEDFARLMDLQI